MVKLFGLFGKKNAAEELTKAVPYRISTEFVPYRLYANQKNSLRMFISLKNLTAEPTLSSVVVEVPKGLSLDETGISKEKEVRLGQIAPNEEKQTSIDIYGDAGTDKGEYTLSLTAFIHYRDYGHVLNAVKKKAIVEVV
ncbi:MAG: hypothetical protein QW091_01930 [Candidatus Micrarchaeaceae archaeon]